MLGRLLPPPGIPAIRDSRLPEVSTLGGKFPTLHTQISTVVMGQDVHVDSPLAMHGEQVPAHITGWMSNSLATSSLLKAVGVGGGSAEGAASAAAAIKWISKDGIGAAGRVLVGQAGI